jgi:hypothetical protein
MPSHLEVRALDAEIVRLRADNQRLAAGLIEIINLPENWNAEGPIPYSTAMKIARAALTAGKS